ncbi:DNA repair protein RecO [Pelistega sp. NLN82]|uniref:DNA repair protein RecO n=1 Tax=Pelistega ratti TaxID=2652177 RepID=A0A6L9Y5C3_9BURK|nr:DNA repair protein RecO [Pelistega ratti]NEN75682.1 DNA repair protein RecO [Pelistega ratti]
MNKYKVLETPAFLLQAKPWSETSCIATVFSREYGLVAGIAKGAKRPYSVMRPILSHFQPLLISWSGKAEVKTITQADFDGFLAIPSKILMSGWYMNELLLRGLPKEDPHPIIFDEYTYALESLCAGIDERSVLRRFEWYLLKELGYGDSEVVPDFHDLSSELALRQHLRTKIETYIFQYELNTRKVVQSIR